MKVKLSNNVITNILVTDMPYLTRSGYIADNLSQQQINELTVTPLTFNSDEEPKSFEVFARLQDGKFAVPRYWAKQVFGPADEFKGYIDPAPGLIFNGKLKSSVQEDAALKSIDILKRDGGGVLCLPTGTGKTVIALHVACAIQVKTLVIVHKQFLVDQWAERIEKFVPLARVGRLRQSQVEVDNCDIVIGMLQSISMRKYDSDIFEGFGLVILDEVHVVPAPVFSRALRKICSPCMLGMSATPERRDGMSCVIKWFLGPIFVQHKLTDKSEVTVFIVQQKFYLQHIFYKLGMANVISQLCRDGRRNSVIVSIVNKLVADGRKVIVLSDRRNHCTDLKELLDKTSTSCMPYMGGMKEHQLKEHQTKNVILGTFAMAKEGLDIPELDAVVLATPRSDVVQACGRIMHGKSSSPVIVDIVDEWNIGNAQFYKRKAYYNESGFSIKQWNSQ